VLVDVNMKHTESIVPSSCVEVISFMVAIMTKGALMKYIWHRWPQEWSVAVVSISPVLLSSSMISSRICSKSSMTDVTSGTTPVSFLDHRNSTSAFSQIIVAHSMNIMNSALSTIVCYLWVFSWPLQYIDVHRFTAYDYQFGYSQTFLYKR